MKQFQCTTCSGSVFGPYTADEVEEQFPCSVAAIAFLEVDETAHDEDGDLWKRLPDLILQDDAPMSANDVAACRASASRIRQSLRLERIATAAMVGVMTSPYQLPGLREDKIATLAVTVAKALIAELDKQA